MFDEYNHVKWPGATKAINEFLVSQNLGQDCIKEILGKHYLVKAQ